MQNFQDSVKQCDGCETRRYRICGIVQGVGFRPFIHRLALIFEATGWVLNDSEGVLLELQAASENITRIIDELVLSHPPMARIISIQEVVCEDPHHLYEEFTIRKSLRLASMDTIIPPDANVCCDCLNELRNPEDPRYRYAFINCTNCGPRYSIIRGMPYDRAQTTMRAFVMCPACEQEYNSLEDRRYHAQPNACPVCGPKLELTAQDGSPIVTEDIIKYAISRLREGAIIAVKSLGGFHLIVDASNENAILELRKRKRRDLKPFAVMVADAESASLIASLDTNEKKILESVQRPIVLLRKNLNRLPEVVAPCNPNIGVMLPSTPLQHLMLEDAALPVLIMTSGNLSGNPILFDNASAIEQLGGIADYFILNDRDIHTRVDDSVVRIMSHSDKKKHHVSFIRRSRGYAPYPVHLTYDAGTIISLGAELKTTVSISKGNRVFMSQHIGDLKNDMTFKSHIESINHLQNLLGTEATTLACDLHPAFRSTRNALKQSQLRVVQVQHHHAHMAACMAENGISGKTIGVIFDGTGYGTDGTIWGGEFLIGDQANFSRAAHLRALTLPGGDKAVKEPVRIAISLLTETFGEHIEEFTPPGLREISVQQKQVFAKMAARRFNAPITSSMGRLFDGISALMGICTCVEYEAQAAIELEALLQRELHLSQPFTYEIVENDSHIEVDYRPIIRELISELKCSTINLPELSRRFHSTIVDIISTVCLRLATISGIKQVVLSGGVFCNEFILVNAIDKLESSGLDTYYHQVVPTNDGGVSLGQIVVAAAKLSANQKNDKEIEYA